MQLREEQFRQQTLALQKMEANLALVKQKLENLILTAPERGQLSALHSDIGASVQRGERLGQIDVLDGFKVLIQADEHYIPRVNIGQQAEFTLAGQHHTLTVSKILPEVNDGRFEIEASFEGEPPEIIRRGQSVQIRLELGNSSTALLLPRGGFFQQTGGQWVYVLDESGEAAVKRNIQLGRQNPEVFEVLGGLHAGDKVISSSYKVYGENIEKLLF
jgi:HlyD family secretion protein